MLHLYWAEMGCFVFNSPFTIHMFRQWKDLVGRSIKKNMKLEAHLSRSNSTSSTRKSLVSTSLWICCRNSSSFCRSSLDLSLSRQQKKNPCKCLIYCMFHAYSISTLLTFNKTLLVLKSHSQSCPYTEQKYTNDSK